MIRVVFVGLGLCLVQVGWSWMRRSGLGGYDWE
jgi:hypothetical protein